MSGLDAPHSARLVLIDFGYACCATRGLKGLAGSPEYAAPEVLTWLDEEGGPRDEGGAVYTCACDMWSAGVTAYAMLTGTVRVRARGWALG